MIFVDTNVVLDLIEDLPTHEADWSRRTVAREAATRMFVANLIVAAELASQVRDADQLGDTLAKVEIALIDLDLATAHRAGAAFAQYRKRGGRRESILSDFLIGAHAATLNATLLTRDRGLSRYFPDLTLITPETHP